MLRRPQDGASAGDRMTTLNPPSRKREAATADQPAGDATYLYCARALRDFGDGFVAVRLPV